MRRRNAPPNAGRQCVNSSSSVSHSSTRRTRTVRRGAPWERVSVDINLTITGRDESESFAILSPA